MIEQKYKNAIPNFNNQEEMINCKNVKITTNFTNEHIYEIFDFDNNENSHISTADKNSIFFEFQNPIKIDTLHFKYESGRNEVWMSFYGKNSKEEEWETLYEWGVYTRREDNKYPIDSKKKYKFYQLEMVHGIELYKINFLVKIQPCKYLLKKDNEYYSIKNDLINLKIPSNNNELSNWYDFYGIEDLNDILKAKNKKQIRMSFDKKNNLWSTDKIIDFNEITNNIECIDNDNQKIIQYNVLPYSVLDLIIKQLGGKVQFASLRDE